MDQYPKIESIGSIGSIILAILEVQVDPKKSPVSSEAPDRCAGGGPLGGTGRAFDRTGPGRSPKEFRIPRGSKYPIFKDPGPKYH